MERAELLAGKTALVTGAGAGIGRCIAEGYAQAGARVLVTDLDLRAAQQVVGRIVDAGGVAVAGPLDVADPAQHLASVELALERFGRLDIACNNAGVAMPATPTAEVSLETWETVRRIDLDGVFYGLRAQLPALVEGGGGVVISISSLGGVRGLPGMAPYAAAKHGVVGLMQTVAWEYGERGIRALSVGPGYIRTGLELNLPVNVRDSLSGRHALGRMGDPAEVADAVVWLSSDKASFLTGSYIPVEGGYLAR